MEWCPICNHHVNFGPEFPIDGKDNRTCGFKQCRNGLKM